MLRNEFPRKDATGFRQDFTKCESCCCFDKSYTRLAAKVQAVKELCLTGLNAFLFSQKNDSLVVKTIPITYITLEKKIEENLSLAFQVPSLENMGIHGD